MKPLVAIALFFFGFILTSELSAAEDSYAGNVAGIDCTNCKKSVAQSLGKIKGVKTIQIIKKSDGQHRLLVVTDGTVSISLADARKALGKQEHSVTLTAWTKTD